MAKYYYPGELKSFLGSFSSIPVVSSLFSKSSIARAPDGNGGIYAALKREGILQHMRQNGVSCCHVYCVDNSLVKGTVEYRILIHYVH